MDWIWVVDLTVRIRSSSEESVTPELKPSQGGVTPARFDPRCAGSAVHRDSREDQLTPHDRCSSAQRESGLLCWRRHTPRREQGPAREEVIGVGLV